MAGRRNLDVYVLRQEPQIYTRDPRLPILPHVMAPLAMGLNLGVFGVLSTIYAKVNAKQMRPLSSRNVQHFTCVCLHVYTAVHAVTYALDTNHDYFDYGTNPKTLKLSPMQTSRWRRIWYLWCISVAEMDLLSISNNALD